MPLIETMWRMPPAPASTAAIFPTPANSTLRLAGFSRATATAAPRVLWDARWTTSSSSGRGSAA